jgi:endoglucanase
VRATGATQPLMIGGLNFAGDPCGGDDTGGNGGVCMETAYMPTDPLKQLIISFHTYNWTSCKTTGCWNEMAAGAKAANLPIVTGEIGEDDCTANYISTSTSQTPYMNWADANNISYLAWKWDVNPYTSCTAGLTNDGILGTNELLSGYDGTPTTVSPLGAAVKAYLLQENP